MYLYMASLRYIKEDEVVKAWYAAKVRRQGDRAKIRAVTAVMRKLSMAIWHVARGDVFDARRLFDADRLKLTGGEAV